MPVAMRVVALGLDDLRLAALAPPMAGAAVGTLPLESPAPEPRFTDPGELIPSERPMIGENFAGEQGI